MDFEFTAVFTGISFLLVSDEYRVAVRFDCEKSFFGRRSNDNVPELISAG